MLDKILDWMGNHPFWTIVIFTIVFFGGLSISIHIGIITSQTKLMPY